MVELITPNEKVRDLTTAPSRIPILTEASEAFEVILTLWTTFDPKQMNTSHHLGKGFHEKVKELTAPDLTDEITTLGGPHCAIWLGVAGLLQNAPQPHTAETMFDWLADIGPKRLHRWLLGYVSHGASASLIEQAANGDRDALREIICDEEKSEYADAILAFFSIPAEELPNRLARTLKRFYVEVYGKLDIDFSTTLGRAAAARSAVTNQEDATTVIEDVTQGIDYDIPLGVTRVVLIPSLVVKPLSVIDQHRDSLIVYYGVADEFVDSDPDAPPSWLLNIYKALSDERRLRILKRLAEGDASLEQLTELLGLSKSTVHHHMSVLRSARLIRVQVPAEKGPKQRIYSLREHALADTTGLLDSYLRPSELEVDNA